MRKFIRITAMAVLTSFLFFSTSAAAEDMMQKTLRDTAYGGVIGGLIGGALVLLSKSPGDILEYIPQGAGIGMLLGAAYGIATSGVVQSAGQYENGKFTLNVPTVQLTESYDKTVNAREVIESVGLLSLKY
ncbi:MAG: hypothetical protein HZB83_07715 [Deltaproteobacteria bacterium]|nr:hypothetical protein [Deltaproteobacteria bacterium]